jgi:N-acyl-D-aspartate/D-glutamate deacylase
MFVARAQRQPILGLILVLALALACSEDEATESQAETTRGPIYDVALMGGRLIDPETRSERIANLYVRDGRIARISIDRLPAEDTLSVEGLVVAPGFIDLHVHGQDPVSWDFMARDGVTTALELEAGVSGQEGFIEGANGTARIHHGASAGHIAARILAKHGVRMGTLGADEFQGSGWMTDAANEAETTALLSTLSEDLDAGAIGVGMGIAYTPGASAEEVRAVFQLAADRGVALFVHIGGQANPIDPLPLEAVLAHAEDTGAALHVVHLNSSSLAVIAENLARIDAARARGVDVTTEVYPYTAASTFLESALFSEGWRERRGADYEDLQWVATGERLTAESFARYRAEGGTVILHMMKPEWIRLGIAHPGVMIGSDGMAMVPGAHPRGAGTHARVLAKYVREEGVLALEDAIAKMTLLPAQRLEAFVPAMRRKGRLREGADADITVFDPATVLDRATFEDSMQASTGIPHVLVSGTFVVRDGELVEGALPGQGIRAGR